MLINRLNPDTLHHNPVFTQVAVVDPAASLVYVGGQNAVNVQGEIVGSDLASQTVQVINNLEAGLAAGGATMADVFKMTIYIVRGQPLQEAFAAAGQRLRSSPPPTISVIMVAGLANPAFLIEIEAVAAIKAGGQG